MLIEDVEKLIKQLQEEQGMTQKEARVEAIKRALEDMDDIEVERGYDRPLGGLPAPNFDEHELEGDIGWEEDDKPSESKGFFRRLIDKFGKADKEDDFDF